MPLVNPLPPDADEEVRDLSRFFNETLGFCPNSVLTMQRRPAIARAFIQLNMAVMDNEGRVTSALKRLVGYVVQPRRRLPLLPGPHHPRRRALRRRADAAGEHLGLPHPPGFQRGRARGAGPGAGRLDGAQRGGRRSCSSACATHWDDGEVVELLGVIALFGYLNRWNDSMATTLEEGAEASGRRQAARRRRRGPGQISRSSTSPE